MEAPLRVAIPAQEELWWTPQMFPNLDYASQSPSPTLGYPYALRDNDPPSPSSDSPTSPSSKTYSFVSLPGNAVKKRPRRRYDEIERLYQCSYPDCTKAYGTLNHLNAHVTMQKHGPKRSPNGKQFIQLSITTPPHHSEFKELRKQWRKAKKDSEAAISAAQSSQMPLPAYQPIRRASMGVVDPYAYNQSSIPRAYANRYFDTQYAEGYQYNQDWQQQQPQQQTYQQYTPSPPTPQTQLPYPFTSGHHHSQSLPHIQSYARQSFDSGVVPRSHSHSPMNCLPPNSTLLTPLPGYESQSHSQDSNFHDRHRSDGSGDAY